MSLQSGLLEQPVRLRGALGPGASDSLWMTPVAVGALVLAVTVFACVPVAMRRPE